MKPCTSLFLDVTSSLRPSGLYCFVKPLIARLLPWYAGECDLRRYAKDLVPPEKIRRFQKTMIIRKGYYDYEYFNICFLNNALSLCLKAVCAGYLPQVEICNAQGANLWEMFFEQPFSDVSRSGKPTLIYDKKAFEAFPQWQDVYDPQRVDFYGRLYNSFIRLKENVRGYVQEETDAVLNRGKILGVLCRGTDYTKTRPKGHPIQPAPEEILRKTDGIFQQKKYDYIYLATEDSGYDALFRAHFRDRLLINRRQYYDQSFQKGNLSLIKDVHFDRENDEYLKGLEYLSSLLILSRCQGLVAGNCGGTEAAVFWNQGKYEDTCIFNLGLYE